jgi:hypothetical protein
MLGKLLVRFRVVDADGEIGDVELPDGIAALTERLAFGRSPAGEGFREPRQHDSVLALVVGESVHLAIGALQIEGRRGIADVQLRSGLVSEADNASHKSENDACGTCNKGTQSHGCAS